MVNVSHDIKVIAKFRLCMLFAGVIIFRWINLNTECWCVFSKVSSE